MPRTSHFLSLPDEIIVHIISKCPDNINTLTRVCTRTHQICKKIPNTKGVSFNKTMEYDFTVIEKFVNKKGIYQMYINCKSASYYMPNMFHNKFGIILNKFIHIDDKTFRAFSGMYVCVEYEHMILQLKPNSASIRIKRHEIPLIVNDVKKISLGTIHPHKKRLNHHFDYVNKTYTTALYPHKKVPVYKTVKI
jgi:hypothetical protein